MAVREVGSAYVADLAPAAIAALRKSWGRGNPAGALEVLKALGFLNPQGRRPGVMRFTLNLGDSDIDDEIQALADAAEADGRARET